MVLSKRLITGRKRYIFVTLVLIAAVCIFVFMYIAKSQESEEILRPVITIGKDNYAPFTYMDTDGQVIGIDVDIAKEAFDRLGYDVSFVNIEWEDRKEVLESRTADCIWSCFAMNGFENTSDDEYKWAGPYMRIREVVAVGENSDIYTLDDIAGKIVGVESFSEPENMFCNNEDYIVPQAGKVFSLHRRDLIFAFLKKEYVDAIATEEISVEQYMSDYDMHYRILEQPLYINELGVAFRADDDRGIEKELTEVLNEMYQDGTTRQILSKYVSDPDKYMEVYDND